MKQLWLRFLLATFIAGSWLSLEVVQCQKMPKGTYNISNCYNKTSGKTCFTTILANNSKVWSKSFTAAKDLCKAYVPGSSLIVINSLQDQRSVEGFIGRQAFENETFFTDARKISARKRFAWSWVNGHHKLPKEVKDTDRPFHVGACVEFEVGKPLAYCVDNVTLEYHYICEYSDPIRNNIYQQNNKYYFGSGGSATWYDARSDCLLLGGDLASLVDLERINGSSWLKDKNRYWIGLHRNQWFWKSTGAAITYTNWEGGYPDDSADKECICLSPKCSTINNVAKCDERKWWSCNCNHSYPLVCQHEKEKKLVTPTAILSSTSADFKSSTVFPVLTDATFIRTSSSSSAITMTTTTIPTTETTAKATTKSTTKSATKATTKSTTKSATKTTTKANTKATTETSTKTTTKSTTRATTHATSVTIATTTNTSTPPKTTYETGLIKAFTMKEILLVVMLFVVVVFIVVAVILVLRKRKYARRNEESSLKATKQQNEPSAYGTVVPHNGPSDGTVPPTSTIYAEVEMNQRPTPSSNAIYASVQPTGEAVDTGKSVVYADLDFVQNVQKKPKSSDKIAACLSPINAKARDAFTSDGNAVYAKPFKPDRLPTVHTNMYHQ